MTQNVIPLWKLITIFIVGVAFVSTLLVLAIASLEPTPFQYKVIRIALALDAAAMAALIPGLVQVQYKGFIQAIGALGVFVLVYLFSPAILVSKPSPNMPGPGTPISVADIKKLVSNFRGSDPEKKRTVSNQIAELYGSNPTAVVEGLVDSILAADDSGSYRVNIYIARTLQCIKGGWHGTPQQFDKVKSLRETKSYKDKTFKENVDNAISKYH